MSVKGQKGGISSWPAGRNSAWIYGSVLHAGLSPWISLSQLSVPFGMIWAQKGETLAGNCCISRKVNPGVNTPVYCVKYERQRADIA